MEGGAPAAVVPDLVVLLNSGYQVLNYIMNEWLKRIMEQTNVLEPGQGGGRQGRSVNIDVQTRIKLTNKKSESSKSTLTLKRLQRNVAGSSLARDEYVSYTRR